MATFDTNLRQIVGAQSEYRNGSQVDYSVNMIPSGRSFHDGTGNKLNLEQPFICSDADWSTIETFYKQNADKAFTFPWHQDGNNYTMRFLAPPRHFQGGLAHGYRFVILTMGEE